MTTYRVGLAGATVYDANGQVLVRLAPGCVVVEGSLDVDRKSEVHDGKRVRYSDKRLVPEDK